MANGSSKPSPYLIPVLGLFILAGLIFIVMLVNYFSNPSSSPTLATLPLPITPTAIISPTPSTTSTITLTPRPTWTLRPSSTATQTPTSTTTTTPTLIRTITPAKPAQFNDRYELKPWDFSQQARTVELMRANAILKPSNDAFRALAYAEAEAALRFPQALEAVQWNWDRAYNLVRISDPSGISLYSGLIDSAISSGQVRSADLPAWFKLYETRLELKVSALPPQPGELGRELIELKGDGSAYLWLVESPTGSRMYPLLNDLDFVQGHENAFMYDDLTGDAQPELVIYRKLNPGDTVLVVPNIFDLTVSPPVELPIQDQVPQDFGLEPRVEAVSEPGDQGVNKLLVTHILNPACPVYVSQEYSWNGSAFITTPLQYKLVPVQETLAYCQLVLDAASAGWGPAAAITIANAMLPLWPPPTDIQGHTYPADAIDQLRYRLGVLYALADQESEARQVMSEIVDTPSVADSNWVAPAELFLRSYQIPENIIEACQQTELCNLRDALQTLLKYSATSDPAQALQFLQSHAVTVRSSGVLDFDGDGQAERWLIIQPKPGTKLEFWILNPMPNEQMQAVFVQTLEAGTFLPYIHQPAGSIPVIEFELGRGFIFRRIPGTRNAYIQWVDVEYARPTVIKDGYFRALNGLLNGDDPASTLEALLSLFNSPRFIGDCIAYKICDQFHYTLGLAYDLAGEQGSAIDEYLWVWRNYGQSPYATMARLKLDHFPLATYTRTPAPSSTTGPTRTPTSTRTPTPTTHTPTATNSPTATMTPTETSTSSPNVNP